MKDIAAIRELAQHYRDEADFYGRLSEHSLVGEMYRQFSLLLTSAMDPPKKDTEIKEAIRAQLREAVGLEDVGRSVEARRCRDGAKLLEWVLDQPYILEGGKRTADDEMQEAARQRSQNEGGP